MSLFSHEEICRGCTYAVFHECCKSFCKCTCPDGDFSDYLSGKCENKSIDLEQEKTQMSKEKGLNAFGHWLSSSPDWVKVLANAPMQLEAMETAFKAGANSNG